MDAIATRSRSATIINTSNSRFQLSYVNGIRIVGACSYPSNLAGNPFFVITVTDITYRYGTICRFPGSGILISLNIMGPIRFEIVTDDTRTNIRKGISADSDIAFPFGSDSTSFSIITNCDILVPTAVREMTNSNRTAIMSIHIVISGLRTHTKSNIVALSSCSLGYDLSLRINNT